MLTALLAFAIAAASDAAIAEGAQIYATACASCHAVQKWGSPNGPSLRGVGMATLDFYLQSGRMPAAVPWIQVEGRDERAGQRLSLGAIRAVEAYLAPTVAGGPALPTVIAGADLERGRQLFETNCEHCHGVSGTGGAVGDTEWAPSLHEASINVVADAIRSGPGEMPRFGEHQLDQSSLDDVAAYVVDLQNLHRPPGAPPFRSGGPIPEGLTGYLAIVALVAFIFTFWRADADPREREESIRRDEGVLDP